MVRTIGIDPGECAVKIIEIDGSYRKLRLLRAESVSIDEPGGRLEAVAAAARAALDGGMRGEVFLGHPCREAVLRVIELPFQGHEAIRKVVKAEVEGEIHSHVVDDMVVDFHEIGTTPEKGTKVLVASVPKDNLRKQLKALSGKGIEPETVDLDTMALWRAAHWAGAFATAEGAVAVPGAAAPVTAVVDFGARSTKVILVEGEQLVEMRALRLGDAAIADEIARRHTMAGSLAREAVRACLRKGTDQTVLVMDAPPAVAGDEPTAEPTQREVTVTFAEVEAAQTAFLQRLAREMVRYLTSSGRGSNVSTLWITGGAAKLPGLRDLLREVFTVEPKELDLLAGLQHTLDPEVAAELGPTLAVALGLALTKLGGPDGLDLRQEDLAFTRGFERVKTPLAIVCVLGLLSLLLYATLLSRELQNLELEIGRTYIDPKNPKALPLFHGQINSVFASKWFEDPRNFRLEQSRGKDYVYRDLVTELASLPVHRRIAVVREKLKVVVDQKQKESGIYEDVSLESGLAVLVRFSQMMKAVEPNLGRYLMLRLSLEMKAPSRYLEFVVAFRGDDFRDRLGALERAIDEEYARPDSPFMQPTGQAARSKESLFKPDPAVRGSYYTIRLGVKNSFEPFGPSASTSVGSLDSGGRGSVGAVASGLEVK